MTTMDKSSRDSKEERGPPTTSDSKKWIDTGMKPLPKDLGSKIQPQYQPWFPRELFFPPVLKAGSPLGVQMTRWHEDFVDVPDAVTEVRCAQRRDDEVLLRWKRPRDNAREITSGRLRVEEAAADWMVF